MDKLQIKRVVIAWGREVHRYISYIGVRHHKGYGFFTVLVWKWVYILLILVWN